MGLTPPPLSTFQNPPPLIFSGMQPTAAAALAACVALAALVVAAVTAVLAQVRLPEGKKCPGSSNSSPSPSPSSSSSRALVERLREEAVRLGVLPEEVEVVEGECSAAWRAQRIYLRLVDRGGRRFALPVLRRAILHEAAHVAMPAGFAEHGPEFWSVEGSFVTRAERAGLAVAPYSSIPAEYYDGCIDMPVARTGVGGGEAASS